MSNFTLFDTGFFSQAENWMALSAFGVLITLIFLGIFILYNLRKKILQKEKRINEIIKNKTENLSITVNKLTEENAQLYMLSSVAMHTESCVFITDAHGEILWSNPGFTKKTGYTLEKFKRAKGNTIMEASCNPEIISIINQAIMTKKSIVYDSFAYTKFCRKFYISSQLTPIFDDNGELIHFVIIDTDISEYVMLKDNVVNIAREFSDFFQTKIKITA